MKRVVVRRSLLALVALAGLLGVVAGTMATVSGAAGRPDFAVTVGVPRVTVRAGESALVSVQVNRSNGFAGPVTLSLDGAPLGSSSRVTPQPNLTTGGPSTITVAVPSSARPGSYSLTAVGTSGVLRHTHAFTLVVTAAAAPRITVGTAPSNLTVRRGQAASFAVSLGRTNVAGPIALSVRAVPAFAAAGFSPAVAFGNSATLTVTTTMSTPLGSADLVVIATAGATSASTTAHLTVSAGSAGAFSLSGAADRRLTPGVTGVIDVTVSNPNPQPLKVTSLTVTLAATSNSACTLDNFRVTQFRGSYPLTIPARSIRSLSQLGVPQSAWPTLGLLNLPMNQDACKNNSLALAFAANGSGR